MDFDQWKIPRPGSACQRPEAARRLTPPALTATFTVTGAWRSWLSRWPVKPEAAGSSPVAPALFSTGQCTSALPQRTGFCAAAAHTADSVGGRIRYTVSFVHGSPCRRGFISTGCSAVGSAFGSGPKGRRFKPAQPECYCAGDPGAAVRSVAEASAPRRRTNAG